MKSTASTKLQQDALLPQVENGTLILIGATTENPFFEVNKALISRSTVFQLQPLTEDEIRRSWSMALSDQRTRPGAVPGGTQPEALDNICNISNGDASIALNAMELAVMTTPPDKQGVINRSGDMEDCMQKRSMAFDHDGESHYDNISAFIKSMRGSDPDAAVFYLARACMAVKTSSFLPAGS
jgi:putative ATPase